MIEKSADKKLQAKLRAMIDADGLKKVSDQLGMSRKALAIYLADLYLYMRTGTFRGIEASLASAEFRGAPSRNPRGAPTKLQAKLRAMIEASGLTRVSQQLDIGTETLARYLADLYLHTSSFRGIEASVASAQIYRAPVRETKGGRVHVNAMSR